MARVYGRIQGKDTKLPLQGEIRFEPRELWYIVDDVAYANFGYVVELDERGAFEVDVAPGEYNLCLLTGVWQVEVPAVNKILIKDLLEQVGTE